jgi:hypothetical protein
MGFDPLAPVRLGFRIGIGVLKFELRVIERLLGAEPSQPPPAPAQRQPVHREEPAPRAEPIRQEPMQPEPVRAPSTAARPPVAPAPEPAEQAFGTPEPHVDVETELVAESADPGAEEGAGAELHVDEPWDGYRKMSAADIRDRVVIADTAELAVVQLYESAHRKRRTVLEAIERRSKELANSPV